MKRTIVVRARCLRLNIGLGKKFWVEAMNMAYYFINRSPRAALDGKVAEEVWTSSMIDYFGLRVFGCPAYVHISNEERLKLDAKSRQYIFFGVSKRGERLQALRSKGKQGGDQ